MTEAKNIEAFIKAVDNQYFDAFINEGEICMNTLQWFRDYESKNPEVGDKYEGAIFAAEEGVTFSFAPIGKPELFKVLSNEGEDLCIFNDEENGNILSLYTIFGDTDIHYIQKKFIDEFNNHRFCLITAPGLFLEKLNSEFERSGCKTDVLLIKYLIAKGAWSPFFKREKYTYQNETRVFLKDSNASTKVFRIGSMKNFAFEIFPQKLMYKICKDDGKELIVTDEDYVKL